MSSKFSVEKAAAAFEATGALLLLPHREGHVYCNYP